MRALRPRSPHLPLRSATGPSLSRLADEDNYDIAKSFRVAKSAVVYFR